MKKLHLSKVSPQSRPHAVNKKWFMIKSLCWSTFPSPSLSYCQSCTLWDQTGLRNLWLETPSWEDSWSWRSREESHNGLSLHLTLRCDLCYTSRLFKTEAILSITPGMHVFILVINDEILFKQVYKEATMGHLQFFLWQGVGWPQYCSGLQPQRPPGPQNHQGLHQEGGCGAPVASRGPWQQIRCCLWGCHRQQWASQRAVWEDWCTGGRKWFLQNWRCVEMDRKLSSCICNHSNKGKKLRNLLAGHWCLFDLYIYCM